MQYHPEASAGPTTATTSSAASSIRSAGSRGQMLDSPLRVHQQPDDLNRRGEDLVRRLDFLITQRFPHALGVTQILPSRLFDRVVTEFRDRLLPGLARVLQAARGRRRSPRKSRRRALRAARSHRAASLVRVQFGSLGGPCAGRKPERLLGGAGPGCISLKTHFLSRH